MFRCCFCRRRVVGKPLSGGRPSSSSPANAEEDVVTPPPLPAAAKRKYKFHNSSFAGYHGKRNTKNHRKHNNVVPLNRTMFVVPVHVPPGCASSATIIDIESSVKISRGMFSVTVVPAAETRRELRRPSAATDRLSFRPEEVRDGKAPATDDPHDVDNSKATDDRENEKSDDNDGGGGAIKETQRVDLNRTIRPNDNETFSQHATAVNGFVKPDVQLYTVTTSTVDDRPVRSHNNDKPIAEVKPTTTTAAVKRTPTERRKSTAGSQLLLSKKQEKRPSEIGPNLTPFNEPQKALQLVSVQINSPEWEAAVTGLQNISRLSMFHGKELRPGSLQPFARTVAKHIKSLRSQVARAACTAVQKMFSHVPRSVEPDAEEIASALFPRTADTNKFLRIQSAEAFNAMVDNVNPIKCVHVITSKGIKHGNRMVRAEACRLLARVVDKLGVNGTLHLPTESRDAVITAATSMVIDNTPTSRQAAQHILAKLSEDPRGAALISSAASPNVKATLNKSLSRIFLK